MIITLCGSARFEKEFKDWNLRLTFSGHTVFSLTAYPSDHGKREWYSVHQKDMLDKAHKRKIRASDAIFILNVEDYVGESTRSEIAYARKLKRKIIWAYRYNGPSELRQESDTFPTCPYSGCEGDILTYRPPCAICYE